jgi:hypothetical protein
MAFRLCEKEAESGKNTVESVLREEVQISSRV